MKLEELCAAVQEARYYNERFTRREYTSAFRTYTERFGPLYMEAVRETAEDPDGRRVLAEQLLDLLEAGWKRQRPWNRTMVQAREKQMLVTYLSPMLLGLEEPLCQEPNLLFGLVFQQKALNFPSTGLGRPTVMQR